MDSNHGKTDLFDKYHFKSGLQNTTHQSRLTRHGVFDKAKIVYRSAPALDAPSAQKRLPAISIEQSAL